MPVQPPSALVEPLEPVVARRLIRHIVSNGAVSFSRHAEEEMAKDGLTSMDVSSLLRGGTVEPAELERGSWRYRSRTPRAVVVVAFHSTEELRIVTAWRIK